ncbi:phage scaffolding protein [Nocardiopsis terrae]|uniref:phage scaffolding protein n=1 Tax=Streptomyces sp. NPDC057554 TaxID=3350538 RepID=UPI0036C9EE2C
MTTHTPTLTRLPGLVLPTDWVGLDVDELGACFNVYADGTRLPVCAGAAPEEGDNNDSDDDNDGGGESDDDQEGDEGDDREDDEDEDDVVKLTRTEFEEMKRKQKKANREAAQRRKWLEKAGFDPRTGKKRPSVLDEDDDTDDEGDDEDEEEVRPPRRRKTSKAAAKKSRRRVEPEDDEDEDDDEGPDLDKLEERWTRKAERAAEKAAARAEMRYKLPLARTAAKAALADAGWTGKDFGKVMKLIDLDDVELDEDDEIIGIEDQVDDIKSEFPDWFRRRSASSSRGGTGKAKSKEGKGSTKDVGGSGQAPKSDKKGWKNALAEQAFGKSS